MAYFQDEVAHGVWVNFIVWQPLSEQMEDMPVLISQCLVADLWLLYVWLSLHLFHVLDVLVHQWDKSPMFCEGVGVSETFILDQLYEGEGHFSTMVREQCTTPIDVECLWGELENLNLRLS